MTTFLLNISNTITILFRILIDSCKSKNFYTKVLREFSGYGFRYIFTLMYISTVIVTIIIIFQMEPIKQYLTNRVVTNNSTLILDGILKDWESFTYNGKIIESDKDEPIMIKAKNGKVLVAVDSKDEIAGNIKKDIPLIFGKSKLQIAMTKSGDAANHISFGYSNFLGNSTTNIVIDSEFILQQFKKYINYFDRVLIYIVMPLTLIFNLFALFFERLLMIGIVYFGIFSFASKHASVKSAIRIVMFSCGLSALIIPYALIYPFAATLAGIVQLWTSILVVMSIVPGFLSK
jgi:hypothetical protein